MVTFTRTTAVYNGGTFIVSGIEIENNGVIVGTEYEILMGNSKGYVVGVITYDSEISNMVTTNTTSLAGVASAPMGIINLTTVSIGTVVTPTTIPTLTETFTISKTTTQFYKSETEVIHLGDGNNVIFRTHAEILAAADSKEIMGTTPDKNIKPLTDPGLEVSNVIEIHDKLNKILTYFTTNNVNSLVVPIEHDDFNTMDIVRGNYLIDENPMEPNPYHNYRMSMDIFQRNMYEPRQFMSPPGLDTGVNLERIYDVRTNIKYSFINPLPATFINDYFICTAQDIVLGSINGNSKVSINFLNDMSYGSIKVMVLANGSETGIFVGITLRMFGKIFTGTDEVSGQTTSMGGLIPMIIEFNFDDNTYVTTAATSAFEYTLTPGILDADYRPHGTAFYNDKGSTHRISEYGVQGFTTPERHPQAVNYERYFYEYGSSDGGGFTRYGDFNVKYDGNGVFCDPIYTALTLLGTGIVPTAFGFVDYDNEYCTNFNSTLHFYFNFNEDRKSYVNYNNNRLPVNSFAEASIVDFSTNLSLGIKMLPTLEISTKNIYGCYCGSNEPQTGSARVNEHVTGGTYYRIHGGDEINLGIIGVHAIDPNYDSNRINSNVLLYESTFSITGEIISVVTNPYGINKDVSFYGKDFETIRGLSGGLYDEGNVIIQNGALTKDAYVLLVVEDVVNTGVAFENNFTGPLSAGDMYMIINKPSGLHLVKIDYQPTKITGLAGMPFPMNIRSSNILTYNRGSPDPSGITKKPWAGSHHSGTGIVAMCVKNVSGTLVTHYLSNIENNALRLGVLHNENSGLTITRPVLGYVIVFDLDAILDRRAIVKMYYDSNDKLVISSKLPESNKIKYQTATILRYDS